MAQTVPRLNAGDSYTAPGKDFFHWELLQSRVIHVFLMLMHCLNMADLIKYWSVIARDGLLVLLGS